MAEHYVSPHENSQIQVVEDAAYLQESSENTLIHVDFRPNLSKEEVLQRIGEVVTSWWLTEAGSGAISHELISVSGDADDTLNARFKQFKRGFHGDELGVPHPRGWSGPETVNVLDIEWNAESHTIKHYYVHPRNFRYILPKHEARKRANRLHDHVPTVSGESRRRPVG